MQELSLCHRRYGYRRIGALLAREGRAVNHKRLERMWREEKLSVPARPPRRRRKGPVVPQSLRASHRNHVWTYDFMEHRTLDGRRYRLLTVVDEYTRECLSIRAERRLNSGVVVEELDRLAGQRGAPKYIRSDNGPEFTARVVREWLATSGIQAAFVQPGSPWENGRCESFNGKLRDELLNGEAFYGLREAQVVIESWRQHYNTARPHSSLGYRTPAEVAATGMAVGGPLS